MGAQRNKFISMSDEEILSDYETWTTMPKRESTIFSDTSFDTEMKMPLVGTTNTKSGFLSSQLLRGEGGTKSNLLHFCRTESRTIMMDPKVAEHLKLLRYRISPVQMLKIVLPFTLVLLLPAIYVTITKDTSSHFGDECFHVFYGAASCLAAYYAF
eukprot:UN25524